VNIIGIINVYKEKGFTSHDVVAILRKVTGMKAGHTGTLDPNAQGVLPICLGRATKLTDFIVAQDKTYIAEVVLGVETDTADMTGTVLRSAENVKIYLNDFSRVAESFIGEIEQVPPMYSAIKIGGKKLYELARAGQTVERKPRKVRIDKIKILSHEANRFVIETACSKGTYIRSLCADIGTALGCGATMGELTRTQTGNFFLENAVKIDELKKAAQENRLAEYILPVDRVLPYPRVMVRAAGLQMAKNGNTLPLSMAEAPFAASEERCWLCAPTGELIGLFSRTEDGGRLRAEVML